MGSIKTKAMKIASCSIIGIFIASSLGTQTSAESNESNEIPGLDSKDNAYACRADIHPRDAEFPSTHVASLEKAPNGDILFEFYGYRGPEITMKNYVSRLPAHKKTWEKPRVALDTPKKADGNAILWNDGKKMHLFTSTTEPEKGFTTSVLHQLTSKDNGKSWSEAEIMSNEKGLTTGARPLKMSNGKTLLPIYSEKKWKSGFLISDDDFKTWNMYPETTDKWITSPNGSIQPSVVELDPGHLLTYMRTRDGYIYESESHDYGQTWSEAKATDIPNDSSRIALLKLQDGNLLLAYNPNEFRSGERSPLSLSLSDDDGDTWSDPVNVETATTKEEGSRQEFSYPDLMQTEDGAIHLGYSHHRNNMRHVIFNEDFVRAGKDLKSNPKPSVREYKNGNQKDVNQCTYMNLNSTDRIKELVHQYRTRGDSDAAHDIFSDQAAHMLEMKLNAVSHYEDKGKIEKAIKHLEGFKQLGDHLFVQGTIRQRAVDTLQKKADDLIKDWQKTEF